jgi:bifunctional UDP-N-acetylglucosamine pyrophosphorylase / glucosamine-1-phosphate N-acetyltransferase
MEKTEIIILAAGKGKRMLSDLPKALIELLGKPFLSYVTSAVSGLNISKKPIIIVGHKKELVIEKMGDGFTYVTQEEQLGTGHAVSIALPFLSPETENILILYCDQPLVKTETLQKLSDEHFSSNATLTMATVNVLDFLDWRAGFFNYSRIIRNSDGKLERVVECKDATEEERKITEVNPVYFIFKRAWLEKEINNINNQNSQGEYYLTDLVKKAFEDGEDIHTVSIDALDALGANTNEEKEILEGILKKD